VITGIGVVPGSQDFLVVFAASPGLGLKFFGYLPKLFLTACRKYYIKLNSTKQSTSPT
jgi:hypothetical protein